MNGDRGVGVAPTEQVVACMREAPMSMSGQAQHCAMLVSSIPCAPSVRGITAIGGAARFRLPGPCGG